MATYSCLPAASFFPAPVPHAGNTQDSNMGEGRSALLLITAEGQWRQTGHHSPETQENARGVWEQEGCQKHSIIRSGFRTNSRLPELDAIDPGT